MLGSALRADESAGRALAEGVGARSVEDAVLRRQRGFHGIILGMALSTGALRLEDALRASA